MRQPVFERFLWATVIGSLWFLTGVPAFADVVPLAPWSAVCGDPLTANGAVWYSRAYFEEPLSSTYGYEHVFRDSGTVPVSWPNADYHRFILTSLDGDWVAWRHYSPEGPDSDNLYAEVHVRGTTRVLGRIPCSYGTPYSGPVVSAGKAIWAAIPEEGSRYECRLYVWDGESTQVVWEVPEGYYWANLQGFEGGLAVWTASPYQGWDGGPTRLFVWDGTGTQQIGEGYICDVATDGRWVIWVNRLYPYWDYTDSEIWLWNGSASYRLVPDLWNCNTQVAVRDGVVAWCGSHSTADEFDAFMWRDGHVHRLTADPWMDEHPLVDAGVVCWMKDVEHTSGFYDLPWHHEVWAWRDGAAMQVAGPGHHRATSYKDGILAGLEWYQDDVGGSWSRPVIFSITDEIIPWTPYSPGEWTHQFKGQLHAHYKAERVPDTNLPMHADLTPSLVAAEYAAAGYDFAAVTEHYGNNQYESDPYIWNRSDTSALGVEHIWDSMEDTASDSHLLGIGFDREAAGLPDWTDGDSAPDSDLMTRYARAYRIQEMGGGMAVVAHPNVDSYRWTAGQVAESGAEGVEVFNMGASIVNVVKGGSNPLALDVWDDALRMSRQAIWATAGDDYTVPWPQFDGGYVMAVCDIADPTRDGIIWALKCGSFYACKANVPGIEAPRINGYWADVEAGVVRLLLPSNDCTVRFATARGGELLPTSGPVASGDSWEYAYTWQAGDRYIRAEVKDWSGISWTQPVFLDRQASNTATWPVAAPGAFSAAEVEPPLTLDVADAHLEISTPQSQIGHVYGRVLGTYERPPAPPMGYVGECYEFLPDEVLDGANALTITYDQADVQLMPEADLTICRYDETTGQWQSLATAVDTDLNNATCQIVQLGIYALSGEIGEDVEPPTIEIVSPADSSSQSGNITVSAAASDNNGVSVVRFWLDEISLGSDTYGADGWTRTADLSVYPGGPHTIGAEAEDASGNRSHTAITINVVSAAPAPDIVLSAPAEEATFWIWEGIHVSGSWADDDPLTLGIVALDDMPRAVVTPTGPAEWQGTVCPGPGTEGQRQLRAIGLDQHENRAEDARTVMLRFFSDVPQDQWAYLSIYKTARAEIVRGYNDGTYQPALLVTRDQMAVYISRALAGGDANVPAGPSIATFDDVPTDHWAFKYIEYCYAHGVVEGYDLTTYAPDVVVNRAQMAVYVARAVVGRDSGVPNGPETATFNDVPTDYWAYKYVEYCKAQGIVQGYDPVTYAPEVEVTRDQMAVYVQRAFELPT